MKINSYKDLIVWQKAFDLVMVVYELSAQFPKTEQYILIAQIRRAAISIPSNIAEGFGRKSEKDYKHFYKIALGSAFELETQLLIAQKLGYSKEEDYREAKSLLEEICRMLNKMSSS